MSKAKYVVHHANTVLSAQEALSDEPDAREQAAKMILLKIREVILHHDWDIRLGGETVQNATGDSGKITRTMKRILQKIATEEQADMPNWTHALQQTTQLANTKIHGLGQYSLFRSKASRSFYTELAAAQQPVNVSPAA